MPWPWRTAPRRRPVCCAPQIDPLFNSVRTCMFDTHHIVLFAETEKFSLKKIARLVATCVGVPAKITAERTDHTSFLRVLMPGS